MVDYGTPRGVTLLRRTGCGLRARSRPASLPPPLKHVAPDLADWSGAIRLQPEQEAGGRRSGFAGPVCVGCEAAAALGNAGRAANGATAR